MKKNDKPHSLQLPHMEPAGVMQLCTASYRGISCSITARKMIPILPGYPSSSPCRTWRPPGLKSMGNRLGPQRHHAQGTLSTREFLRVLQTPLRIKLTLTEDLAGVWDVPIPATVLVGWAIPTTYGP